MGNFPGPYQLRFFMTAPESIGSTRHVHNVNCDLSVDIGAGQDMADYDILTRNNGPQPADEVIDAYVALLVPFFNNTHSIDRAELWKFVDGTNTSSFYSTYDIAEVGTGGGVVISSEIIITYRTLGGGTLRQTFLDTVFSPGVTDSPPFSNTPGEAMRGFVLGDGSFLLGRDNTLPFAAIGLYKGTNERLFKERNRP